MFLFELSQFILSKSCQCVEAVCLITNGDNFSKKSNMMTALTKIETTLPKKRRWTHPKIKWQPDTINEDDPNFKCAEKWVLRAVQTKYDLRSHGIEKY